MCWPAGPRMSARHGQAASIGNTCSCYQARKNQENLLLQSSHLRRTVQPRQHRTVLPEEADVKARGLLLVRPRREAEGLSVRRWLQGARRRVR